MLENVLFDDNSKHISIVLNPSMVYIYGGLKMQYMLNRNDKYSLNDCVLFLFLSLGVYSLVLGWASCLFLSWPSVSSFCASTIPRTIHCLSEFSVALIENYEKNNHCCSRNYEESQIIWGISIICVPAIITLELEVGLGLGSGVSKEVLGVDREVLGVEEISVVVMITQE